MKHMEIVNHQWNKGVKRYIAVYEDSILGRKQIALVGLLKDFIQAKLLSPIVGIDNYEFVVVFENGNVVKADGKKDADEKVWRAAIAIEHGEKY